MELVRIGRRIERAEKAVSQAREAGDTWAENYSRRALCFAREEYARACQANRKG
jgi:hypothetical protein